MFLPFLMLDHVSIPESFLPSCEGFPPCLVRVIFSRQDGDEVFGGSTEDAHGRG